MSKREPEVLVQDMLDSIGKIERYCEGFDKDAFLGDEKTCDAVIRNLEVIGEAVRHLPLEFKKSHSEIPWPQIAGLRNRIVHDYAGVDLELVWAIIKTSLAELNQQLSQI